MKAPRAYARGAFFCFPVASPGSKNPFDGAPRDLDKRKKPCLESLLTQQIVVAGTSGTIYSVFKKEIRKV